MKLKSFTFLKSSEKVSQCPSGKLPEYAFIGRSNVGKSSLINCLANHKNLAKVSSKPGKTQLINHFEVISETDVEKMWHLVDLPGYGYAVVSKKKRVKWAGFIEEYLLQREQLTNVFVLVDSRLEPQKIDLEFIQWLGEKGLPFSIVFTKIDKNKTQKLKTNIENYRKRLQEDWDELPVMFYTSATEGEGKDDLLGYIDKVNMSL
ncbi:ribosome biogenesis GTP-binding protein YihA/YsxC [Salibacteraceae bacterium]|jgi:GTP-binding protein|nr:ribosome biogenesis GTP-binding protein YihA/YsxC [Bacteroidota bacterium]MDB0058174.1 ribosome biogenesis GTP-binding protein YihA/YsxC [Salibacteraceae bacterium]MDB9725098.1 ribosome biogenesis GTP-binding protein YihA/YsxC [Salibacteraceae bacterium]MDC1204197.1 ribosome biogenesis GTP-binding protein YihA/YsxC [Salibacteraceae bacterium]